MGHLTPLLLALRAFVLPAEQPESKNRGRSAPPSPRWPDDVLVFDGETTIDAAQRLVFGFYRHCRWTPDATLACLQEGLVYADDLPDRDPAAFAKLQSYVASHRAEVIEGESTELRLLSRSEFVGSEREPGPFWNLAYKAQALVVGFNLGFDLSRLAIGWGRAKRATQRVRDVFAGGFTLAFWASTNPDPEVRQDSRFHPRVRLKHINSKLALVKMTGRFLRAPNGRKRSRKEPPRPGRFLDLKTLAFALTDRVHSLASAGEAFQATERKAKAQQHGRVDQQYIEYARQDVRATPSLLEAVRREFDRHPIDLTPDQVRSPASIAKAYLRALGVHSPLAQFADIPPERHGEAMTAYFGGRAEVRIRNTLVPVVYLDFLSMYPTVNVLLGLSELLTADRLDIVDATAEVQQFLAEVTGERCFDPAFWRELRGFALIQPEGDVLPTRAQYQPAPGGNPDADPTTLPPFSIGVNPLTATGPLWFALPEAASSAVLTGKAPRILRAWRVVPVGRQGGLTPVALRGEVPIDPVHEDVFRRLIEARQAVKRTRSPLDEEGERLERSLKVTANSGSYGVFAEMNRVDLGAGKRERVTVYGRGDRFDCDTPGPEELGEFCFPIFAALTTSAARLMLALAERTVRDLGGHYAFCDTDSLAVVATKGGGIVTCPNGPDRTSDGEAGIRALSLDDVWERVVTPFAKLNPYDPALVPGSVLKIEDVNYYNGVWQQLYALAISAKRYVLFNLDRHGQPVLRKPSEHGLGHLIDPSRGPGEPEYEDRLRKGERWPRWIGDVWRWLIAQARGQPIPAPAWFAQPAVSRITVTTPRLLESFAQHNAGRSYAESVKPMSFGLTVHLDRVRLDLGYDKSRFQLIGPYETDASKRLTMPWTEKHTGREHRITTDPNGPPGAIVVRTIGQEIARYRVHPEAKSADAAGEPCSEDTVGLLQRRPVYADRVVYTGKESHKLDDEELRAVAEVAEIRSFYRDSRETAWVRVAVPLLQLIPVATIAKAAHRSARMATHYRQGTKDPGDTARRRLLVLLVSEARRLLRRKTTPPDARKAAARFLGSGLAKGTGKAPRRPRHPRKRRRARDQIREHKR